MFEQCDHHIAAVDCDQEEFGGGDCRGQADGEDAAVRRFPGHGDERGDEDPDADDQQGGRGAAGDPGL